MRVTSSNRWPHVLAAAVYLGVSLWAFRAVLQAPATDLPTPGWAEGAVRELDHNDEQVMVGLVIHNTEALSTRPWTLFEGGQCHPLKRPFTLGEHAFVEGLLGVVPYAITHDPIVTYNCVAILVVWLAALAMYALSYSATASVPAAFVAGLLFAMTPMRVGDPTHPMVHGNQWTPLALLFAHRLFARPAWTNVAGLVLFTGLQILDGVYQLIAFAILGGAYGVYLAARNLRRLPALVPKLLVVAAATAGIVAFFFGPYMHTRAVWGNLGGRQSILYPLGFFGFGGPAYLGTTTLVLVAIGLVDRLRGPRASWGYDPRLVYLVGGLLVLWTVVLGIPIPGTGIVIPSPYLMARRVLPGLDAVRALTSARLGVNVAAAFIAGYGVLAITEHRRALVVVVATVVFSVAAVAEVFHEPTARASFGTSPALAAYSARPPEPLLALYGKLPGGAVLDLPLAWHVWGVLALMSHYNLLSAYHHQPIAACDNSFASPLQADVEALARRVPSPEALDALYALGFRSVVVHGEFYSGPPYQAFLDRLRAPPSGAASLAFLGEAADHHAFAIVDRTPIDATLAALAVGVEPAAAIEVAGPGAVVPVPFRNAGQATYRHPDPIEPTSLVARWQGPTGSLLAEYPLRVLLPLALAPGEATERRVLMPVPDVEGEVQLTLAPAAAPELVISRLTVRVRRGAAPAAASRR